jgi:hypothetical protein
MTGSRQDPVMTACSAKPGAAEDCPLGEVAVFKVAGRMFTLVPLGQTPASVSLNVIPIWPSACWPLRRDHARLPPQQAALEHRDARRFSIRRGRARAHRSFLRPGGGTADQGPAGPADHLTGHPRLRTR